MIFLKQSTAVDVLIGPFVDDADGNTVEDGLTISQADVRLSKNGGNMAQKNDSDACTHDELGYYACPLDITDTGTLGVLKVMVHESGALPVFAEYMVVTANVWDTLCGSDMLQADLTQIGGVAQSATDLKDFADTGYDPSTHKVAGVVLTDTCTTNTDLVSAAYVADAVWDEASTGHVDAGKAGAQLWTDIDAILADTNELQTNQGDWATATGFSTHSAADVADAVWEEDVTDHSSTSDSTAEALAAAGSAGDPWSTAIPGAYGAGTAGNVLGNLNDPTAAAIADAVWDEAATGHTDAGKAGQQLWTDIDAILTDTNELQTDDIPGSLSSIDGKIDTIDGIVDDILTDTGTTLDSKIDVIDGIVDNILTDTGTTLNDKIDVIDGIVDNILVDTNELQTDWTNGGRLDLIADAILADTDELQSDDIPGTLAALNDISADDVWDATSSTLSMSFETLNDRVYRFLMNKMNITDADGSVALRNEADDGTLATQSVTDDDTTTVRTALTWV